MANFHWKCAPFAFSHACVGTGRTWSTMRRICL